jgi:serine protease Do
MTTTLRSPSESTPSGRYARFDLQPPPKAPHTELPRRWRGFAAGAVAALTVALGAFGLGRVSADDPAPAPPVAPTAAAPVSPRLPTDSPGRPALGEIADVAAAVGPAVVQLETGSGLGSGVIYRPDGFILTAAHVVAGSRQVEVRLADGRLFEGRVLGAHEVTDIAVIRIEATDLPVAMLGYRDQLRVGETAVALGSPFGFDQTVTAGIVSAVNRTVNGVPMVQTDAAINPGNSGGPLVDGAGRVIGINDIIFTQGGGNDGVGFAVAIDVAIVVADQIAAGRSVQLAVLGVSSTNSTSGVSGAVVQEVVDGSPAQAAGLAVGDRIISVDGVGVDDPAGLFAAVVSNRPGSTVVLRVFRTDRVITISTVLGAVDR